MLALRRSVILFELQLDKRANKSVRRLGCANLGRDAHLKVHRVDVQQRGKVLVKNLCCFEDKRIENQLKR